MLFGLDITKMEALVMFEYLFKEMSNTEFKSKVREGKKLKAKFDTSGYVLKNCKLYAYAWHCHKLGDGEKPKNKDFHVDKKDSCILRKVKLTLASDWQNFSLPEFDRFLSDLFSSNELNAYVGKFINKKMRFLMNSYGDTFSELHNTLMEEGLYAIYRAYPFYESDLHALNIAKTSIHNYGHTIIRNRTAQKNQRLGSTSDGSFYQRCVDLSLVENLIQVGTEDAHEFLFESLKIKPKAKKFLLLLSGKHDSEFSEFLGSDNSVLSQSMRYTSYTKRVREFLEVTPDQMHNLFANIKNKLPSLR